MDELRLRVALLIADGHSVPTIAIVLGIAADKVGSVFRREIEHGAAIARAHALAQLAQSAEHGNVAAQKAIAEITAGGTTPLAARPAGKKAQALASAERANAAGGKFAVPPPPGAGVLTLESPEWSLNHNPGKKPN
jgi:hypothetical protein